MRTLGTQVVVSSTILGDSLITSGSLRADLVSIDFPTELSSFMCVDARQPYSGLTVHGENSVTKSARTCYFIAALGKNFMSDCLSSMAHLEIFLNKCALDKMFLSRNSAYTAMGCVWK